MQWENCSSVCCESVRAKIRLKLYNDGQAGTLGRLGSGLETYWGSSGLLGGAFGLTSKLHSEAKNHYGT